ncbi:MAG: hypothetical protein HY421_01065 [Candidatus Kerfeldbacteria bacterium]|nr:hypothetical protein [Candidatus Kerfeldbacteria bacterium]
MAELNTTYNRGDDVTEDGEYVCVPCGYHRYFRQGEQFTECMSCLSGTQDGHEDYAEGLELWEKAANQAPQ